MVTMDGSAEFARNRISMKGGGNCNERKTQGKAPKFTYCEFARNGFARNAYAYSL